MRNIIESDICARCVHLQPAAALPESGVWDMACDCAQGWPPTRTYPNTNAISECPKFEPIAGPITPVRSRIKLNPNPGPQVSDNNDNERTE